jgi:hypothetical protein
MRDDLLGAQEAINWAVAQIEVLNGRIQNWIDTRPYGLITEPDSDAGYEIIKAWHRGETLPLIINAEAGAIINMTRSSLDLLAVALAERNGHVAPKDVYFPIASSVLDFIDPKDGAIKKIARLSESDRSRIEQLKPYQGGDDVLFSLHQLDIMRKHRKLVGTTIRMRSGSITRWGEWDVQPEMLYTGKLEDGTPLWRIPRGSDAHTQMRVEVSFSETAFANGRPVIRTLPVFAKRATEIIAMFDTP